MHDASFGGSFRLSGGRVRRDTQDKGTWECSLTYHTINPHLNFRPLVRNESRRCFNTSTFNIARADPCEADIFSAALK